MFEVICKKSRSSRQFVKLTIETLPCFVYRTNQDSESGSEINLGLVLMTRIQWWSRIWQSSFC